MTEQRPISQPESPRSARPARHSRPEVVAANQPKVLDFPANLPVSARKDEIMAALHTNQVVIGSGEKVSVKTTQLPKIALALGRGR